MRPYGGYHYNLGRETFLVPVAWEDGWPVLAPGEGRVPAEVDVPVRGRAAPGRRRRAELRASSARTTRAGRRCAVPQRSSPPRAVRGWDLTMRPTTLADPFTPAFLGVRQQHLDVDVRATVPREPRAGGGGRPRRPAVRGRPRTSVRHGGRGRPRPPAARRAPARGPRHRPRRAQPARPDRRAGDALGPGQGAGLRARPSTTARRPCSLAVVDGRTLDSVATGGFLGLWIGVYATSNGRPTSTMVEVGPSRVRGLRLSCQEPMRTIVPGSPVGLPSSSLGAIVEAYSVPPPISTASTLGRETYGCGPPREIVEICPANSSAT